MSKDTKECKNYANCNTVILKGLTAVCSPKCQRDIDSLKPKKEPKKRYCAECNKVTYSRNKYCSTKCSDKSARRRKRASGGTLAQCKKKAWVEFSKYIRQRDKQCFTCGSKNNLQAGHFIKASQAYNYFNFNEVNVNAQCYRCNIALDGNYIEYTLRMIDKYGINIFQELREENLKFKLVKPTKSGYLEFRDKYKELNEVN